MGGNWEIPRNEHHRFLDWGPRDEVFYLWCAWFDIKKIPYEVAGGAERWTIYKHMYWVEDYDTGRISRCCPMEEAL